MSDAMPAHIAEYSALRSEICAFHNIEGQVMSITVVLIGALIGFITAALGQKIFDFTIGADVPFIHLVPLPFVSLGIIFAYTQIRIVQAATYLQRDLRTRVKALLSDQHDEIWRWEIFRRQVSEYPVRGLSTSLSSVRWIFFVGPSLFPLSAWHREWGNVGAFLILLWDFAMPALLIALAFWTSVRLPTRVAS